MEKLSMSGVISLFQRCTVTVVEHLPIHVDKLHELTPNIKDRILYLMTKRGLVTDSNIQQVLHPRLRVIDLSDCDDISDQTLQFLAQKCKGLTKIDLNCSKGCRTSITSTGITSLARSCPHLECVYLRRCSEITDEGIVELSMRCERLRYLNIGGCPLITDASLQALGENCTVLRSINFSQSKVTDNGLFMLVNGNCGDSLNEIHMTQCQGLTDEAVEAVVHFCTNVSILIFSGCPNVTERSREALEEMLSNQSKVKQLTWTIY